MYKKVVCPLIRRRCSNTVFLHRDDHFQHLIRIQKRSPTYKKDHLPVHVLDLDLILLLAS